MNRCFSWIVINLYEKILKSNNLLLLITLLCWKIVWTKINSLHQ